MIIYEVNLSISKAIKDSFKVWLKDHAESMITFPGFLRFFIYEISSKEQNTFNLCVHYYIESEFYLEKYFINNADKMRQEGLNLFGNNFSATRRILSLWD